ncbi:AsmA family protein [Asaia krungthepensis]|uniref:AsmA domain-containing protein n=1 Tax=Asaia krungthepensis NRIC 0535 TaxID=1307925 RepID=A0ABQ0Q650_9PROT|nr:AsmA family protein [Asaia krungthepensis]GBQ93185.1 hypothetical protein AA0535_2764 [Asaia krungthepensis NRIC 0535]
MKRLIAALIVVLVLATGLAVTAQVLIDRSNLRQDVIAAVKRQTGRDLTMARFSVGVLPWPGFSARDVVLNGRNGATDEPTLRARDIRASIALIPLMWREIRLETLTLNQGSVFFVRDPEGRASWEFERPSGTSDREPGAAAQGAPHPEANWKLRIGSAKLNRMTLALNDTRAHRSGEVMIDHAEFDGLASTAPYLDIHGLKGTTPFRLNGHVGPLSVFQGDNPPWAVSLGATLGQDGKQQDWLNLDGQITNTRQLRGFSGVARGEIASLRDLEALFPNAGLPDYRGIGGEIGFFDADPQNGSAGFDIARLGINHLHFHLNASPSWHGVSISTVHADADTLSSALTISGVVQGVKPEIALQGRFGTLAQAGTAWQSGLATPLPVSLDMRDASRLGSASGLTAHVNGQVGVNDTALALDGQAQSLDVMQTALHDVALKGNILRDASGVVQIRQLSLTSHEAEGTLEATARMPLLSSLEGKLHFTHLDLDALSGLWLGRKDAANGSKPGSVQTPSAVSSPITALTRSASTQDSSATGAGAAPLRPLPGGATIEETVPDAASVLRQGQASVDISADTIRFNKAEYSGVTTHLGLDRGKLTLDRIKGEGNGMTLSGQAVYDMATHPAHVSVTFSPLLFPATLGQNLLGLPDLFRGPLMLVGQIDAQGDSKTALIDSMNGHLGLSMVGGTIDASQLGPYLGDAARSLLSHRDLDVRCLGLHARFENGNAQLDTIGMEAGALSLSGHGVYGLGAGTLDLHLLPRIGFGGTGASTPVLVTGTLASPQARQEAGAGGRFQLTIGGAVPDNCPDILSASRESFVGEAAPAPKKHSQASELLHGLGILH